MQASRTAVLAAGRRRCKRRQFNRAVAHAPRSAVLPGVPVRLQSGEGKARWTARERGRELVVVWRAVLPCPARRVQALSTNMMLIGMYLPVLSPAATRDAAQHSHCIPGVIKAQIPDTWLSFSDASSLVAHIAAARHGTWTAPGQRRMDAWCR